MLGLASSKREGLFSSRSQPNKSIILSVLRYSLGTSIRNDHWQNYCSRLMCAKNTYNLTRFQFKFLLTNRSGTLLLTSIFIAGFVARWLQSKLLEYSKLLVGRCARTIGSGKVTSALKRLVIGYVYNYRILSPRTCLKLYIWENVVCCIKRQTDRQTRTDSEVHRTYTHIHTP